MSKVEDKIQIIETIKEVALKYDAQLVGRTFLYVFEGRAIEVVFRRKDFMHLTGVDTNMSGEQFFKNVISGKLRANQIYFSRRHPYDLCAKKISQLPKLISVTNSEIFILEDTQTVTFTYKFGLTDLECTVCLSKDIDKSGKKVSRYYIARSLRAEDSFDKAADAFEVQYIFSKPGEKWLYDTIMYADKRCSINSLPPQVLDMLDDKLKSAPETEDE
ncbi:MAG: PBECR4 domain-containing protein [Lachnospiraceae bacterium]|nr:PBECR4 domain-containing protein [Lachnospiraceae bacterium]